MSLSLKKAATYLAAVATVALVVWLLVVRPRDEGCSLSGKVASELVSALTRKTGSAELFSQIAGLAVPKGCVAAVNTLVSDPNRRVTLHIEGRGLQTISGSQFGGSATTASPTARQFGRSDALRFARRSGVMPPLTDVKSVGCERAGVLWSCVVRGYGSRCIARLFISPGQFGSAPRIISSQPPLSLACMPKPL
jgi:hypothetical protein